MKRLTGYIRLAPAAIIAAAGTFAIAAIISIIWMATSQPWLGISLVPDHAADTLVIEKVKPNGPARALKTGATLSALISGDGDRIVLEANDKIEEPDTIESYDDTARFMAKQTRIHQALLEPGVQLEIVDGAGEIQRIDVVLQTRPLSDLPTVFWAQMLVALGPFVLGTWVFLLRRNWAAGFFAAAGIGIATSAAAAALYSTRELALDGTYFRILSGFNHCGATLFGSSMIALFLTYPRPVVGLRYLWLIALVTVPWQLGDLMRVFPGHTVGFHLLTATQMIAIIITILIQYLVTKGDPLARASLRWLGLSVIVGAGAFVLIRIVPLIFGIEPTISQGYAFLFFLLIYAGLALGVARYRLFDIDIWAFRILFYLSGAALLLVVDALLILVLALEDLPAFGIALVAVVFLYLPLRDMLVRRFLRHRQRQPDQVFNTVVDIAFANSPDARQAAWQELVTGLFNPLKSSFLTKKASTDQQSVPDPKKVEMREEGLKLAIPAIGDIAALELDYAHAGRKLFSPADVRLASDVVAMLQHAIENRFAHEEGVAQERARIASDMHDNIGSQLLTALHSDELGRKDMMIRRTLTDLRDILNDATHPNLPFADVLADLRAETAERAIGAEIELNWTHNTPDTLYLQPHIVHTLRSIVREVVSNVIRHANAQKLNVQLGCADEVILLEITDDGNGFDVANTPWGNGLTNIKSRVVRMGGDVEVNSAATGVKIVAKIPVSMAGERS